MKISKPEKIDQTITIRLTTEMLKKLEAIAKANKVTVSEVIRQALADALK